jgi:antirestriction protein ArdC
MNKPDAYQEITDKIVAALESGTAPWVKPWASCGSPRNAISGREYSGINTVLLAMTPFTSSLWLTFKQALDVGANVRKGEHGTRIVLFKPFKVKDVNASGEGESVEKTIPLLRTFTVFNAAQIDNLPEKYSVQPKPLIDQFADNAEAERLLAQAKVVHGSNRACFIPSIDEIRMPNKLEFKSIPDYYATALHELTHWTGHKNRLARDFSGRFGDSAYAFEELIAELGAAFSCAHCGIDGQLQHASYIASWIKVLKGDKKAIFTASSAARKATEFLIGTVEQEVEENEAIEAMAA